MIDFKGNYGDFFEASYGLNFFIYGSIMYSDTLPERMWKEIV